MAINIFKILTKTVKLLQLIKKVVGVFKSPKTDDYLGKRDE